VGAIVLIAFHSSQIHPHTLATVDFTDQTALELAITSCYVTILPSDGLNGQSNMISLTEPRPWFAKSQVTATVAQTDNTVILTIDNNYPIEYCNATVYLPTTQTLASFTITCTECVLIQETQVLTVTGATTITAQTIYANIENLATGTFNFNADEGFLQVNMITVTGDGSAVKFSNKGDIVIQSDEDMKITFQSPSQTFCFAAPEVQLTQTECAVAENGNFLFFS